MTRLTPRRRSARRPPALLELRNRKAVSAAPRTIPSGLLSTSPQSASSGPNADSPYPRSIYSPVLTTADSPNSKVRYNDLADIQLQNELNATLTISPGPTTPRGPERVRKVATSSAPPTQESYPRPRTIRSGSLGNDLAIDSHSIPRTFCLSRLGDATTLPATHQAHYEARNIQTPKVGDIPSAAQRHPHHHLRHARLETLGDETAQHINRGPSTFRPLPVEDVTGTDVQQTNHEPRPARPSRIGSTTTPATRDSYPGPFTRLQEYTDPDTRPSFLIRRESHAEQPDDIATPAGLASSRTPEDNVRKSSSQPRAKTSPIGATHSHEFPDGGLDLDMDHDPMASDFEDLLNHDLNDCHARNQHVTEALEQSMEELVVQRAEHVEELALAQLEIYDHTDRLQDAEGHLMNLQQQLDDAKTHVQAVEDDDVTTLVQTHNMNLAQIASLTEQFIEANERLEAAQSQLTEANDKIDTLTARSGSGSISHNAAPTVDDDFVKALLDNETALREQIVVLKAQYDDHTISSGEQQEGDNPYFEKLNAAWKLKVNRLDALWGTLRNFQDVEATTGKYNALQARIIYLEAFVRKAKAQINGTGEIDDVGEDEEHQAQIVRLKGEIRDLNSQLQDALDSLLTARCMEQFWKDGSPDLEIGRGYSAEDQEEAAQDKTYFEYLAGEINSLQCEVNTSRVENDKLQRTIRTLNDGTAPAEIALTKQLEEDTAATDDEVNRLNEELAVAYNKLWPSQKTNRKLRLKLARAREKYAAQGQRIVEVQGIHAGLEELLMEINTEQEDDKETIVSLRRELQEARQEIARLRDEHDVEDTLDDSGFVDNGTPLESDELPHARRARRWSPEVDEDFDDLLSAEYSDDLISPSSFLESEPSPRAPKSGRTREQTQSLTRSPAVESESESDGPEDVEDARHQRHLAAATPVDPRGGIGVISRSETARALRAAKRNGCKRKRCT